MDKDVYIAIDECILQFSRPQRGATSIGYLTQGAEGKNLVPISSREYLLGGNFKAAGRKEGF